MRDVENKRNIPLARPSLGDEEWQALRGPLQSGWVTQGPQVKAFEVAFAKRHTVKHAFATTSCTTALHLALIALGIGPGDEVIVPAFTWIATANVVLYCGATPVFVDVHTDTYNMDVGQVAEAVTERTKAVIPVHLFGLISDMDALRAALPNHVALLEDAACAAGASYKGRPAGGLGDIAAFSFHPRKSITTGEGGMVTTDNEELAETVPMLRDHGASVSEEQRHTGSAPYVMAEFNALGFNYRMSDLLGAIGVVQLSKLDRFVKERAIWAAWYNEALGAIEWLHPPAVPPDYGHAWQSYVITLDGKAPLNAKALMARLHEEGVGARPGTHAVTELGLYRERLGLRSGQFPVAKHLESHTVALPLHNNMSQADYEYVVERLRAV